jgi:hypothetical protein
VRPRQRRGVCAFRPSMEAIHVCEGHRVDDSSLCALRVLQHYYKLSGEAKEVCPAGMIVKALGHKTMAPSTSSFKSSVAVQIFGEDKRRYRSYVRTSRGWVLVCDSTSSREATASAWTATPLCASLELCYDVAMYRHCTGTIFVR